MKTSRPRQSHDFYMQLQNLHDGQIDAASWEKLEEKLRTDPAARQEYYTSIDIDLGLTEIASCMQQAPGSGRILLPTPARKRSRGRFLSYLLVATASVIAGVLLDDYIFRQAFVEPAPIRQHIAATVSTPRFFATLVRSTDCEWEDANSPFFEGRRLLTSELHLRRGVAEFRFGSGVRLVLEGPARLTILSQKNASLQFGKVVLHGHELAEGFRLDTPQGTLTDIGTEYGASVDESQNMELHVFQGSVLVESSKLADTSNVIEAGDALRLGDGTTPMEHVPLRPEMFQREVPDNYNDQRISSAGLMARDSFSNFEHKQRKIDWHVGGVGWKNPWRHTASKFVPSKAVFSPDDSLESLSVRRKEHDGLLRLFPTQNIAARDLRYPVRMDTDAIYYVSFYLQKQALAPQEVSQYGSISLRESGFPVTGKRIVCGMNSDGFPLLIHNDEQIVSAPPLAVGVPHFFVVKIVANSQAPDQVMSRVFLPSEEIPEHEPLVWTNITTPDFDDTTFDTLLIYSMGVEYQIDEIRVTSSWEQATRTDEDDPVPAASKSNLKPAITPESDSQ